MLRITLLVLTLLCVSGPSLAITIHVPGDQPTIALGLAVAVAGDTVLVGAGTYTEHDLVMPCDVTLRGATGSPDGVVIDAQNLGRVLLVSECSHDTRIEQVTLTRGRVEYGGPTGFEGGGIECRTAHPRITRCVFRANHAHRGGGLNCSHASPILTECHFVGNTAYSGGAVHLHDGSPQFLACTFSDNAVETDGGALQIGGGSPLLENCVLTRNTAHWWGGGLYAQEPGTPHLLGCTLVENETVLSWGSAIFSCGDCQPRIENTLVAFNSGDGAINAYDLHSLPEVLCCDVYGNNGGNYGGVLTDQTGQQGNISADPLFCDLPAGDLTLSEDSPCLPEHNECQVLIGALPQGCGGAAEVADGATGPFDRCRFANPYVAGSTITLGLPPASRMSFALYDAQGRCVREFVRQGLAKAGTLTLRWDGRDRCGARLPTGLYFYRLQAGTSNRAGRIHLTY